MRTWVALSLLIAAGCSRKPEEGTRLLVSAPRDLYARDDLEVSRWVDSQGDLAIRSLHLQFAGNPVGLGHLARLKGLRDLALSGFKNGKPIGRGGKELFVFDVALSDAEVRLIGEIPSLGSLTLWYGSLSPQQRLYLKDRCPGCRLTENLNKY